MIWVLAALATYRVTRLVVADRITARPREWLQARFDAVGYLVGCVWCASVWIAPGAALLAALAPDNRATWVVLGVPALSAVAGFLASLEPDDD